MRLQLRILRRRLAAAPMLVSLRLLGLTLAAVLAAVVPTFVDASMQQVLARQIASGPDTHTVTLNWAPTDLQEHESSIAALDQYLRTQFLAGLKSGDPGLNSLRSTGPRSVQVMTSDGTPLPDRKFFRLGMLPDGLAQARGEAPYSIVAGRLPRANAAEVVLLDRAMVRSGYQPGDRLRVPVSDSPSGEAATVTVVGILSIPESSPWADLTGVLEGCLLTDPAYWTAHGYQTEEATWTLTLPAERVRTSNLASVAGELRRLPLVATRLLPNTEIARTPLTWMDEFLGQMQTMELLLLIVILPILLLVAVFSLGAAQIITDGRRVEIAVCRSRGDTALRVLAAYLAESVLLIIVAAGVGVLLTGPITRILGLSTGFLQLVNRPALPVAVTLRPVAFAFAGAAMVEAVSLIPLVRALGLTVVSLRQVEAVRSPLMVGIKGASILFLAVVIGYGTWQIHVIQGGLDPLSLVIPGLFLIGVALLLWQGLVIIMAALYRLMNRWLSAGAYLALSLMRNRPVRHQMTWLMLVVTIGMGTYGANLARTLDRDLVASTQYHLGADLRIRTYWEEEMVPGNADGKTQVLYHEPPYTQLRDLPGSMGTARVQLRTAVPVYAGSRNLGRIDLQAINPQEFGRVARFLPGLPPSPGRLLQAMADDERAALVSRAMADRLGLKPGDNLSVRPGESEAPLVIAGVVDAWPGRLPQDGDFAVISLDYAQDNLGLMPYDTWVRLLPGASLQQFLQTLRDRGVRLLQVESLDVSVALGRREPKRLGLYGMLTAGFIVSLLVMGLGYLLNVGLILQSRAKELGVLRAMGMSTAHVARSLYLEQLILLSGAMITGLLAGRWAGLLYLPVIRRQMGVESLPIQPVSGPVDYLLIILGAVLALGFGMFSVTLWMRRLAIGKTLRLGEDG
jgi:putative ABC transport system permease protein